MKILPVLMALTVTVCSCSKDQKNNNSIVPNKCGDRYDKELFPSVKTTINVQYGTATNLFGISENLLLDIYEPAVDTVKKRAMVIFVHGGSWTGGTKNQGKDLCTLLAKKGYIAASIDYRLGVEMPFTDKSRGEAVYRGVQDIKAAVRFARANAGLYKIDTSQIFIGGYSAGAVNAAHATYWNESEVPLDIDKTKWGSLEGNGGNAGYSSRVLAAYTIAGAIVNLNWIQSNEPAIVCINSKTDRTIPYNSGVDGAGIFVYGGASIVPKALSVNIPAVLFTFENIGHGDYLKSENFAITAKAVSDFLYSKVTCP